MGYKSCNKKYKEVRSRTLSRKIHKEKKKEVMKKEKEGKHQKDGIEKEYSRIRDRKNHKKNFDKSLE